MCFTMNIAFSHILTLLSCKAGNAENNLVFVFDFSEFEGVLGGDDGGINDWAKDNVALSALVNLKYLVSSI